MFKFCTTQTINCTQHIINHCVVLGHPKEVDIAYSNKATSHGLTQLEGVTWPADSHARRVQVRFRQIVQELAAPAPPNFNHVDS